MIEPMEKVLIGCRYSERKRLLRVLRSCGVVHLIQRKKPTDEKTSDLQQKLNTVQGAIRIAADVTEQLPGPVQSPDDVAIRLNQIPKELKDISAKITRLKTQLQQQQFFGNLSLADLDALSQSGISLSFWRIASNQTALSSDFAFTVLQNETSTGKSIVAIEGCIPEPLQAAGAVPLAFPPESASSIKTKLHQLEERSEHLIIEKQQLARHLPALKDRYRSLHDTIQWRRVLATSFTDEALFIVTGWVPSAQKILLSRCIDHARIAVGMHYAPPEDTDEPPSLWTPPKMARPINALFRILGTTPGYREIDVTPGFMIALPIFCALLIADGGYGLLLMFAAILGLKFTQSREGKELSQLILIIGSAAVLWGILIAGFFGFDPARTGQNSDNGSTIVYFLSRVRIFDGSLSDSTVVTQMITLSFVLGTIHMTVARIWRARRSFPSLEAIAQLGWTFIIWGMLLFVTMLVLGAASNRWMVPLFITGAALVVMYTSPNERWIRRIGLGLAGLPFGALGVLSDTISYIRLMAVGLASTILGATFNLLAAEVAQVSIIGAVLVFVLGHSLNIALALVALFAHGVRLNMLEFSNHLGMNWTGYPFAPFCFAEKEK